MTRRLAALLIASLGASAAAQVGSPPPQSAFRTAGLVRTAEGTPVAGATVSTADARTVTDSSGRFALALARTDSTTLTVRRLGFEVVTFTMPTDSLALNDLSIELEPVARAMPAVAVNEERIGRVPTLEGFAERRTTKEGFGFFLGRDDIARREGMPLSTMLQQAKGVRIIRQSGGRTLLRFTRWSSRGNSCAPRVWLDGVVARDFEIDDIRAANVEAVELYPNASSAPVEFATSDFVCGVVAIWTRRPILKSR